MNKVVKLCPMMVAVFAIVLVASSNSYAQVNCGPACQINGTNALTEPASLSTAVGGNALVSNTSGDYNTAVGYSALEFNTAGQHNTAVGQNADVFTTTGDSNTAVGTDAVASNTTGGDNTGVGDLALNASTGNSNTALGWHACLNLKTGSNVMCLGAGAGPAADIAGPATYIAGIWNQTVGAPKKEVCIDKSGKLGTNGCPGNAMKKEVSLQQQIIQAQGQEIARLQQRMSQLESLIAKKPR